MRVTNCDFDFNFNFKNRGGPRTPHLGRGAPALNAAAFAVLHLVSPWSWPVFFLVALPWAYAVWWKRSLALRLIGHLGMLAVMSLGMIAAVAGWV